MSHYHRERNAFFFRCVHACLHYHPGHNDEGHRLLQCYLIFVNVTDRTYERISFDASIAFDVGEVNALQFLTIHLLLTTVLYVI